MRASFSDVGIVLKSIDFSEADKLVGVLTHIHGYQELIAKGARRMNSKKAPHLDLFNLVRFQVCRGHPPQLLTQADTQEYYTSLKQSLEKIRIALTIAEILTAILPHGDEDKELFLSLKNFFTLLNKPLSTQEIAYHTNEFGLYIIRHLGYPEPKSIKEGALSQYFESIINKKIISRELK